MACAPLAATCNHWGGDTTWQDAFTLVRTKQALTSSGSPVLLVPLALPGATVSHPGALAFALHFDSGTAHRIFAAPPEAIMMTVSPEELLNHSASKHFVQCLAEANVGLAGIRSLRLAVPTAGIPVGTYILSQHMGRSAVSLLLRSKSVV